MSGGEAATHQNFYIFVEFRGFSEKVSEEFHNFCCRLIWSNFFPTTLFIQDEEEVKENEIQTQSKDIGVAKPGDSLTVTVVRRLKAATLRGCQNFQTAFDRAFLYFMDALLIYVHNCVHEHLLKTKHWQALNKMEKVENKYKKQKKNFEKRGNGKGMKEMEGKDKSIQDEKIMLDVGEGYRWNRTIFCEKCSPESTISFKRIQSLNTLHIECKVLLFFPCKRCSLCVLQLHTLAELCMELGDR